MIYNTGLDDGQLDRALGVIWGLAAGETLVTVSLSGGWSEGTALSIPILETLGAGLDLGSPDAGGRLVRRWIEWVLSVPDRETPSLAQAVLSMLAQHDWESQADDTVAHAATQAAQGPAQLKLVSAATVPDCGALLRSAAVALGYLNDAQDSHAMAAAARAVAALTDPTEEAAEASIIYAALLRRAVLTGELDLTAGLRYLEPQRASKWWAAFEDLGTEVPDTHSSISNLIAAVLLFEGHRHSFRGVMEKAVDAHGKYYTQPTVALTGALAGGIFGAKAIPHDFRKGAHGWPGIVEDALERLIKEALEAARAGLHTRGSIGPGAGSVPTYNDAPGYDAPPGFDPPAFDAPAYVAPTSAPATGSSLPPPGYDSAPPLYS